MKPTFIWPVTVAAFLAFNSVTRAEIQIPSTLECSALSNSWVKREPFTSALPFTLSGNTLRGERLPGRRRPGQESYIGTISSNKLIKISGHGVFFGGNRPTWRYQFSGSIKDGALTSIRGSLETDLGGHRDCSITFLLPPAKWAAILAPASAQPKEPITSTRPSKSTVAAVDSSPKDNDQAKKQLSDFGARVSPQAEAQATSAKPPTDVSSSSDLSSKNDDPTKKQLSAPTPPGSPQPEARAASTPPPSSRTASEGRLAQLLSDQPKAAQVPALSAANDTTNPSIPSVAAQAQGEAPSASNAVYGKWSDSPDKNTCDSGPDEGLLISITPKGIFSAETDCTARDTKFHDGGVDFDLDCFKGGRAARWFAKAFAKPRGSNELALTFRDRKPSLGWSDTRGQTYYKCTSERNDDAPSESGDVSRWQHNGSVMSFIQRKESLEIDYIQPRPSMLAVGVRASTTLFLGTRAGDAVEGTAYIFHPDCGPVGYQVSGRFSANGNALILSGGAPRLARNCDDTREATDTLRFERIASSPVGAPRPSFRCADATSPDEHAICASPELSHLDNLVADGFKYVRTRYGDQLAKSIAVQTLQNRRACGSDSECIKEVQIAAIKQYRERGAPLAFGDAPPNPSVATSPDKLKAPVNTEIYDYSCKVDGKTSPLRVDANAKILVWRGAEYTISDANSPDKIVCAKAGWHAEGNGTSFDFCAATQGYAEIEKDGNVEAACDLKRSLIFSSSEEQQTKELSPDPAPPVSAQQHRPNSADNASTNDLIEDAVRENDKKQSAPNLSPDTKPPERQSMSPPQQDRTADPGPDWLKKWSAQQKVIEDSKKQPPPENTEEELSCNSAAAKQILVDGTIGKTLGYVERYKRQANANSPAGIALEQVSHWRGTVVNVRETNRTPGRVSCAAEFEWSNLPSRESLQMVGMILLTEGIKDPSCIKINYQVQPLLDKPGQVYVSWRCNDG